LIPSTCLNSRKNKEKSERLVTAFVRVPGMYETGPRYQASSSYCSFFGSFVFGEGTRFDTSVTPV
jgi:hypothetical protein